MRNGAVLDGRYRIEQKLAAGGFGSIYRATDLIMGREVALKVLHRELADDASVVERFRREASALARLRDPHTITMYDVGLSPDGTRYIVMELLRGESLFSLFHTTGPLPWQRVVAIAHGVCSSLREAHAFQIVHRDLKPANIHLERHSLESDYVKVLDFGIAKLVDGSDVMQPSLTLSGQLVGTYDYMSPEQMLGGACTGRADVFALAVIVYEMISGVRPYGPDAKGPASMLMALLGTEPAPLSTHVAIPPALDRVVMKALAQDPKERLDVDELDDVLARILDAERGLALGTMDVPAGADLARLTDDDEATWIDQLPPRNTPTTISQVSSRITPTTVPTLIGTLPAMRTPPRGVPIAAAGRPSTPAHGVPIGAAAAQSVTPPTKVQRKTPLRGTPPPELQRKVASAPELARRAATAKTELHDKQADGRDDKQPRERDDKQSREGDPQARERDDKLARGHAPTEPPMRRTPMRGTPPPNMGKPPRGGMKTSASSEDFTRIETPRGLASGTTRPPSKPMGSMVLPGVTASIESSSRSMPGAASTGAIAPNMPASSSTPMSSAMPMSQALTMSPSTPMPVSPVGPTASIEQAIAEEIDHAVDAMVVSTVASPKPEVSLPRPGSPAQAGIWPAPERIRPLTVRFAVGSGTELPSLENATKTPVVALAPAEAAMTAPPVAELEQAKPRSALRYIIWAFALFSIGFAAALGIGVL